MLIRKIKINNRTIYRKASFFDKLDDFIIRHPVFTILFMAGFAFFEFFLVWRCIW